MTKTNNQKLFTHTGIDIYIFIYMYNNYRPTCISFLHARNRPRASRTQTTMHRISAKSPCRIVECRRARPPTTRFSCMRVSWYASWSWAWRRSKRRLERRRRRAQHCSATQSPV